MNLKTIITSLFKIATLILVVAILLPSAIKLNHAFTHNTHQVCLDDNHQSTHFHASDLDCDFYKFQLNTQFHFNNNTLELIIAEDNFKISASQYDSISDFQKLQIALRGPPQLI